MAYVLNRVSLNSSLFLVRWIIVVLLYVSKLNERSSFIIAKNKKKYEWMIDEGYITREEYKGYINKMHSMMRSCFDRFIPDVVPNNIIEQYEIKPNDMLVLCCDGMSDWVSKEKIFKTLTDYGVKDGIDNLISESKELALNTQNYFDDITAIAVKWVE